MESDFIKKSTLIEAALLKALSIRHNFENYYEYIAMDRLLDETKTLIESYHKYYLLYKNHAQINFDLFLTQFCRHWHASDMTNTDIDWYKEIILHINVADTVESETALLGLINKQFISKINTIGQKEFNSSHIKAALEEYEKNYEAVIKEEDQDVCGLFDIDFTTIDKSIGVPYWHPKLQDCLGGMVLGSLILYNAAYGVGKSACVHTQVSHTLRWAKQNQINQPVLWINTEGSPSQVWGRQWSNLFHTNIPEGYKHVLKNKDKILAYFKQTFGENSFFVAKGRGKGLGYLKNKIIQYNPCLVILDMAAQIMGNSLGKNTTDTKSLELFFDTLREITAEYCPIIATVQAGNSAKWWDKEVHRFRYKKWPDSDDIYGSKSAIQGAAETIITIGRNDNDETTRYLRVTKLKDESPPTQFVCELEKKFSLYNPTNLSDFYD
jgi:hypothetical protein